MTDAKINTDTTQRLTERINQVLESNVPANRIQAITGLQRSLITRLRSGEVKLENVTFQKAMTLYEYSDTILKEQ
ncbi:hypothetical protein [Staphylococcus cohnii]|uniref:hypothetical protein n=1 Tax=Staphylococcus cohnii TaxID=29382 RepID=UPI0005896364|nr:hypothetical protein [Staphylococcus cohnii]MDW4099439.1 hypothetical protein [Staphylococcus saprophyticus]TGS39237.1 hypothetical protein EN823_06070 [bacterium M00.F.Ca.ET.180.01.1.1]OIS27955.1 hypothetical protein RES9_10905 [Staphylococcus cohnii]OIS29131.1 hypothetical protein RES8_10285 [Staphylococcus cohnii]OIS33198.1 hypothetical protein RES10_02825 [Staphylococcus cohnii]